MRYTRGMLPMPPDMNILDRMVLAVERVRDRLIRATSALEAAGKSWKASGESALVFFRVSRGRPRISRVRWRR